MDDIEVLITALETGHDEKVTLTSGGWTLVVAGPCYLAGQTAHTNGTTVLTLKGCAESAAENSDRYVVVHTS